jgi:hypothetical protein
MNGLRDAFRRELKADLPLPLPSQCISVTDDGLLVGNAEAARRPLLVEEDIDEFLSVPDGYFLAGFWGHGVNSYAFYWCVADPRQRVFLRLPYGGVYMHPEETAAGVLSVLRSYAGFWTRRTAADIVRLVAVSSMDGGGALAQFIDGTYACVAELGLPADPFKAVLSAQRSADIPSSPLVGGLASHGISSKPR